MNGDAGMAVRIDCGEIRCNALYHVRRFYDAPRWQSRRWCSTPGASTAQDEAIESEVQIIAKHVVLPPRDGGMTPSRISPSE